MSAAQAQTWKRCSSCKTPIEFEATYYLCNVSTCRRKRTGFVFCSVDCWEAHVPMMRHRESWAEEEKAPTRAQWEAEQDEEAAKREPKPRSKGRESGRTGPVKRRITVGAEPEPPPGPREVLVVAARLKQYVKERFGMNTSDRVLDPLSDEMRRIVDRAVKHAKQDGRKTVLDRDFDFLQRD